MNFFYTLLIFDRGHRLFVLNMGRATGKGTFGQLTSVLEMT
jgi:hypothetical protein